MNKNTFLDLLTKELDQENLPNASSQHNPNPDYIKALITRARIANDSLSRENLAKMCGISISSLNKYTNQINNIQCPYTTQKALETIAGIKNSDKKSVFKLNINANDHDTRFFSMFDNFRSSKWSTIGTSISIEVALTLEEVDLLKNKNIDCVEIAF